MEHFFKEIMTYPPEINHILNRLGWEASVGQRGRSWIFLKTLSEASGGSDRKTQNFKNRFRQF